MSGKCTLAPLARVPEVVSVMLKPSDARTYERFLEYACEKHAQLSQVLNSGLRTRLPWQVLENHPAVLDIGAGQGNLTLPLAEALHNVHQDRPTSNPLTLTMLEPDDLMLARLTDRMATAAHHLNGMVPVYIRATLERTLQAGRLLARHHAFVLASHVFYYFDDWPAIVRQLLDLTAPEGLLCIVLKSDDTDLYRLRRELPWPDEIREAMRGDYFAGDLARQLDAHGIQFEVEQVQYPFDLPCYDRPGKMHSEIEDLVSFWYGIDKARWNAETRLAIGEFFAARANPHGVVRLRYKEDVFWIHVPAHAERVT